MIRFDAGMNARSFFQDQVMKPVVPIFFFIYVIFISSCEQAEKPVDTFQSAEESFEVVSEPEETLVEPKQEVIQQSLKEKKKPLQTESKVTPVKPKIHLDLDLPELQLTEETGSQFELTLEGEETSSLFTKLYLQSLAEKRFEISSDVIFAEEVEFDDKKVESLLKQIDGAEINLELKFE